MDHRALAISIQEEARMDLSVKVLRFKAKQLLSSRWQQSWPHKTYLVNTQYRFIYCPIPKVACTSMKHWFETIKSNESTCLSDDIHRKVKNSYSLACLQSNEAKSKLKNYYKFAIIRDPLDRLESAYVQKFVGTTNHTVKATTVPVIEWVYQYSRGKK